MLKSEAEGIFRRYMEETKAEFTEAQIECIVQSLLKIGGRMVEEALASSSRSSGPGKRQGYFAD